MAEVAQPLAYSKKDFISNQEVKWCPGCGDYSILSAIQSILPETGVKKEDIVFVSGIGCSSRFPYYMDTYGMHTLHGRAPGFATGIKVANPKLNVWLITGDGDGLSIGGNHFIHLIRRNVDINVILFNNEIYGLTKGQYSPTSKVGKVTKSTPYGSLDRAFSPASLALGANATFFARSSDNQIRHLKATILRAAAHKGTSVVEVLQNCVIFNDKTHEDVVGKESRDENSMLIEHGQPMIFGKEKNKGIVLDGLEPKIVTIGENGVTRDQILVHDESTRNPTLSHFLAEMSLPKFPVPLGVFRAVEEPTYEKSLSNQIKEVKAKEGEGSLEDLLKSGNTWTVN